MAWNADAELRAAAQMDKVNAWLQLSLSQRMEIKRLVRERERYVFRESHATKLPETRRATASSGAAPRVYVGGRR